nr:WYL domain-containing protein [Rhodococcus sp. 1R11]
MSPISLARGVLRTECSTSPSRRRSAVRAGTAIDLRTTRANSRCPTRRTKWAALKDRTERRGPVSVTVRLPENGLDLARRVLASRIHDVSEAKDGWCTVVVRYHDIESVRQLLRFGDHIEVLTPAAARERIGQLATIPAERHSTPAG